MNLAIGFILKGTDDITILDSPLTLTFRQGKKKGENKMGLSQKQKIKIDIEQSIKDAYEFNKKSPVITRQMTEEEKKEIEWQTTKHESCHRLKI